MIMVYIVRVKTQMYLLCHMRSFHAGRRSNQKGDAIEACAQFTHTAVYAHCSVPRVRVDRRIQVNNEFTKSTYIASMRKTSDHNGAGDDW